jgi:pimeloyl-ACP methyl ester carboxylesterase
VAIQRRRRRSFREEELDGRSVLDLTRDNEGALRWMYGSPSREARTGRRSYRSQAIDRPELVQRFRFHDLGPNEITQALQGLDTKLNAARGLHRWDGQAWQADPAPQLKGATLLLVHGTFSASRMFSDELAATPQGQAVLKDWKKRYGAVMAFDHPTLAVSPWINALELQPALAGVQGPIDIVCHSRGGLVVAWLLRLYELPVRRVLFVGSPLAGTSLASPYRLRAALDVLANYADVVGTLAGAASLAMPLAAGAAGLARIFGKTLRLGSSLPIADAAVALVPGLAAQQRIDNNLELEQLFALPWRGKPQLVGVGASFVPDESMQGWKFWRRFTHLKDQALYSAADLVFEGENDLVVDREAMAGPDSPPRVNLTALATGPVTHHTSYFRDPQVLKLL